MKEKKNKKQNKEEVDEKEKEKERVEKVVKVVVYNTGPTYILGSFSASYISISSSMK